MSLMLACPSRDELVQFAAGRLPHESREQIGSHLEECPTCRDSLETLNLQADTLVASLRAAAEPVTQNADSLDRIVAAIAAIGANPTPATSAHGQTPADVGAIRDYRLLEKLGEGGMGAVYKALHTRLEKIVALKLLPAERMADRAALARFDREMRAVGKLDHPNIVRAMDAGEHDGTHFLVMECVDGVDVSTLVKRHGRLSVADACEIVRQAAIGLQHAHEHGLVHRDI